MTQPESGARSEGEGQGQAGEVAGRSLDARVAVEVMGLPVVGFAKAWRDEMDCWNIRPPADTEYEDAPLRPVYVEHAHLVAYGPFVREWDEEQPEPEWFMRDQQRTREQFATDVALWGHPRYALAVVPAYSTDIAAAWEVVEEIARRDHTMKLYRGQRPDDYWRCSFRCGGIPQVTAMADTAPLAICLAALRVVTPPTTSPKPEPSTHD